MLGVLDESIELDPELVRKAEKERRNLVLQTYVVEREEGKLANAKKSLELVRVREGASLFYTDKSDSRD